MTHADPDLELAHRLADLASETSLKFFRRDIRRWSKDDGSLATEADVAVEDALRTLLARERSGDAVLGEERGQTGAGRRRWIIDGIDGTVEFSAGVPDWGTLIALEVGNDIRVGLCVQPANHRRYWAVKGSGAFVSSEADPRPHLIHVSQGPHLHRARSYLPPPQWRPDDRARAIATALERASLPEANVDHPAIQVAAGGYEFAIFMMAGPWDLAAPALIVEEAGGRFSNFQGKWDLTTGTALFSNGLVHQEVLDMVGVIGSGGKGV